MISTYSDLYQQTLRSLPSLSSLIIEHDAVSPFMKNLINTTRSIEEKEELVRRQQLEKEIDVSNYIRATARLIDADSGVLTDPVTGEEIGFRFTSGSRNYLDAVDSPNQDEDRKTDWSMQLHARLVAELQGKDVSELTDLDYQNVKNYQLQQALGMFNDPEHSFSPYDRSITYNAPENTSISLAYKATGTDEHGRLFIEGINPQSGRSISFDMSNNPYLNTRNTGSGFDVYSSINTRRNRQTDF